MTDAIDDATFQRIHRLIKKGDVVGIREWVAQGGDVNSRNRLGWTPLMLAALQGRTEIGELLLSLGADSNLTNKFGDTARSLAEQKGLSSSARRVFGADR